MDFRILMRFVRPRGSFGRIFNAALAFSRGTACVVEAFDHRTVG
jgi:hypothetical protein